MTPDANDLCVFAVKRGNVNSRFDVRNLQYVQGKNKPGLNKVSLGELTAEEPCYGSSATAIERVNEDQPKYIRITDFDDFGIDEKHIFMTAETYSGRHLLQKEDILFARSGATVGKTYYYDGSIGTAVFAGYCIRFRFNQKKVLPKYVYWYTKTNSYKRWVNGIQRPSGQPNINKEEYKSYEIVLPAFDVQQKLCEEMNQAERKRKNKFQQANKLSEKAIDNIFEELGIAFKKYLPSTYSCTNLKQIQEMGLFCNPHSAYLLDVISTLKSNPLYVGELENYVDVNPTIDRSALTDGTEVSFVPMPNVYAKENRADYILCSYSEVKTGFTPFKKGDLLWAKITPCMQNGKSFLASDMQTEYGFGSTEFHVLRAKTNQIYMPFLWILLSEKHILEAAQGMFSGSAGQQRVPDLFLKKFPLVLPEFGKQRELADSVLTALKESRRIRQEAEQEWDNAKAWFDRELLDG